MVSCLTDVAEQSGVHTKALHSMTADVEEQNRRLEEQLRAKYAQNYTTEQHDGGR
jgi:hypothetical protein